MCFGLISIVKLVGFKRKRPASGDISLTLIVLMWRIG